MRTIGARDIAQALPFAALIDHLATALLRPAAVPLRLAVSREAGRELLVMPVMADRYAGVKVLTVTADNGTRGLPVIGGHFMLTDTRSGTMLAIMDADELTARRTAAVSALASRALSKPHARHLLVLGTGHLAPYLAEAHASVRSIEMIEIWGRSPDKAARSCAEIQRRLPAASISVTNDLASAVARADIVSAATRATEPLIQGDWVQPGTHIDLVGGYRPDMREIDDQGIRQSAIFVDTLEGVLAEAGDIRQPIERGIIGADAILGDIRTLITQSASQGEERRTLFRSVGSALPDLAAAEMVWEKLGDR